MDRRTTIKWVLTASASLPFLRELAFAAEPPGSRTTRHIPTATGYGTDPKLLQAYKAGELWPLTFTPQQLQTYGAFELQVLEELLRRPPSAETTQVLDEVCGKICRKIGWTDPVPRRDVTAFLRDFYTAERAYLEREQLFGKAKADKYAQPGAPP